MLVEFFGIGGTADYTDCLATELARSGLEVTLITSSNFEPIVTPPYQIFRPFSYSPLEARVKKAFKLARAVNIAKHLIKLTDPDVVHAQGVIAPIVEASLYKPRAGVAQVCTAHDVNPHEARVALGSVTRFYQRFDAVICHSSHSAEALEATGVRKPTYVIPHGRYSPLAPYAPPQHQARRTLGIASDARVVLMFGFIRRYKGLELLLQALELARSRGENMMAIVAGRPLYDISDSVKLASRSGLSVLWHLDFIPRAKLPTYFGAADLVVMPYAETSDSGALELAAAFGKPIVATSVGGLPEAFARYGFGQLVPPNDPLALSRSLTKAYAPPAAELPLNDWHSIAAKTKALYEELKTQTAGGGASRSLTIAGGL